MRSETRAFQKAVVSAFLDITLANPEKRKNRARLSATAAWFAVAVFVAVGA
jgi:hypothetical protein